MSDESGAPKIHIDSDWKAQAQAEKERLVQKEQEKKAKAGGTSDGGSGTAGRPGAGGAAGVPGAQGEIPPASFHTLVGMLASQAIMGLGAMADPQTGRVVIDLEGAQFSIDVLDVLEQKTKGNLSKEEADELKQILAELRSRYVQISQLVAKQMAAQAMAPSKITSEPKLAT
jgi:hypothetical protein